MKNQGYSQGYSNVEWSIFYMDKQQARLQNKKFDKEKEQERIVERDAELEHATKIPIESSDLMVVTALKRLTTYVMLVTQKSPKQYRAVFVNRMQNYCLDALENIFTANGINIRSQQEFEMRKGQQDSALDDLDRHIKEKLRVKAYTRYMDDFILIHSDKEFLRKCKHEIEKVCQRLKIRLNKNKTQIGRIKDGVDYLGFNHKLTVTGKVERRIRASAMIRHKRYLKTIEHLHEKGIVNNEWLRVREQAFLNHMKGTKGTKVVKHYMKEIRRKK